MADADAPDDPTKPDLRFTKQSDRTVSVERDMSGQGHLARGSHTRMSNLRFSMQAKPRDYLDPELAALHDDPPVPKHVRAAAEAEIGGPPEAPVEPVAPPPAAADVRPGEPEALPSMAGRIAQAFRRFVTGR